MPDLVPEPDPVPASDLQRAHDLRIASPDELHRMLLVYKFAVEEVMTKVAVLREELRELHDDNPIEHVGSRLKSLRSIVAKAQRKGIGLDEASLRAEMLDIAGVRITCSFMSDIYRVRDMLLAQRDLTLVEERDYIAEPKANGYKSFHLIVRVPVFLSDRVEDVVVEIQLRTIAMDFWASLEHKIYYKYDKAVPRRITDALALAADVAANLDVTMERIRDEVVAGTGESVAPADDEDGEGPPAVS